MDTIEEKVESLIELERLADEMWEIKESHFGACMFSLMFGWITVFMESPTWLCLVIWVFAVGSFALYKFSSISWKQQCQFVDDCNGKRRQEPNGRYF